MVLDVSKGKVELREQPTALEVGETVPDFAMTTRTAKPLKLSDLRGNVVVLTFIYTRCPLPDFCPLMDRKFSELAAASRLSRTGPAHPADLALVRPRARHAGGLAQACQIRGAMPAALDLRGRLARRAGQDRAAAGLLLRARATAKSPTTSARRSSIQRESSPGWKSAQQRNKWDDRRLAEDNLFTDPAVPKKLTRRAEPVIAIADVCRVLLQRSSPHILVAIVTPGQVSCPVRQIAHGSARSNKCDESKREKIADYR